MRTPAGAESPSLRNAVHVVAGVLTDARGRILLARRTAGRDLAGAWEFPGGKVEPGETPFEALDRELHEELGVRIVGIEPLIRVPQAYAHKRIVLDVYRVSRFIGKPRGLESQALAWSPPEKLAGYPMPPADRPVVAALNEPDRYAITPPLLGDPAAFLASVERALDGGLRRLQLRLVGKTVGPDTLAAPQPLDPREHLALAAEVKRLCDLARAQLFVNGDAALAERLGCGLHVKATQLMALGEHPVAAGIPWAASCHDGAELAQAQALGADFAVLGPVAATPSHPERAPLGWSGFAALREGVSLPIYALGGMGQGDLGEARRHGAQGVAGIRGAWGY
jgi:8-oxo-dGTP diphosphatase